MAKLLLEIDADQYRELEALTGRLARIAGHLDALRNPDLPIGADTPLSAEGSQLCRIAVLMGSFHLIPSPNQQPTCLLGSKPSRRALPAT